VGGGQYDPVADRIVEALRTGGHQASVLAVENPRHLITSLSRRNPDLVFNVLEELGPTRFGAVAVAGLIEILGRPYTGGGPGELYLGQDKALTKRLLHFDGIRYPAFAVFAPGDEPEVPGDLKMPLFVKPLAMDASIGIDAKAVVRTAAELRERVRRIHSSIGDSALAEEFIDGREFYIGVIGNAQPLALPPIEVDFSGLPADKPRIMDRKAKWSPRSAEFRGTSADVAEGLPKKLADELKHVAITAYQACRVRDYGRVDLRMTPDGEIFVIEVNASCYLDPDCLFASAAEAAGLSYVELINRIAGLAAERQNVRVIRPIPRSTPRPASRTRTATGSTPPPARSPHCSRDSLPGS
jgi:D-alanine-D-alanine ligase